MRACGVTIGVVCFDAFSACLLLVELGFSNVSGFMGGDCVASTFCFLYCAFLPHNCL